MSICVDTTVAAEKLRFQDGLRFCKGHLDEIARTTNITDLYSFWLKVRGGAGGPSTAFLRGRR